MSAITQRVLGALYLSEHVPDLIKQGKAIVAAMINNPVYANITPSPVSVKVEIDKLDAAELAAKTKAVGTAQARDAQELVVRSKLRQLEAAVQAMADADLGHAAALITGAAISLRKVHSRKKAELAARYDAALALVFLIGMAVKKGPAYYEWQWSADQVNWNSLPTTFDAKTSVPGLTPMATYFFRFRSITKKGTGEWSQIVSLFVR
jgi:hypothetical protein